VDYALTEYRQPLIIALVVMGSERFQGKGYPLRIEECFDVPMTVGWNDDSVVVPRVIVNVTFTQPTITLREPMLPQQASNFYYYITSPNKIVVFAELYEINTYYEGSELHYIKLDFYIRDFQQLF
jgi:hypothetical protein